MNSTILSTRISVIIQNLSCCGWLMSLSIMSSRSIHATACVRTCLLFQAEQYTTVWICPISFSLSFIGGLLPCFNYCKTVAPNTSVQLFLWDPDFNSFADLPRSETAGSYSNFFLFFWGAIIFSLAATPFYIATNGAQDSNFSTFLLTLIISVFLFYHSHPNEFDVVSHCSFDLHFPNDQWCWAFFICHWPFVHLL